MPTIYLDANNPAQVGSAQKVSILTAEPNTWLFIYSGIANQNTYAGGSGSWFWESTTEIDAVVNIKLDNISGVLLAFATTASLSGIYEEDNWADWYVNSTSLSMLDNGDLVLTASTTVIGEDSTGFNNFSYYVSAKIVLDPATISGSVRWKKTLAAPVASPHFTITAYMQLPPSPGQLIGSTQMEATGVEGDIDSSDSTYYYVPYTITGGLLGKTVSVGVGVIEATFSGVNPPAFLVAQQISGPAFITLTAANRHVTNINFELVMDEIF
jgi:hypothetical protein